jgi:hypothetical protein
MFAYFFIFITVFSAVEDIFNLNQTIGEKTMIPGVNQGPRVGQQDGWQIPEQQRPAEGERPAAGERPEEERRWHFAGEQHEVRVPRNVLEIIAQGAGGAPQLVQVSDALKSGATILAEKSQRAADKSDESMPQQVAQTSHVVADNSSRLAEGVNRAVDAFRPAIYAVEEMGRIIHGNGPGQR